MHKLKCHPKCPFSENHKMLDLWVFFTVLFQHSNLNCLPINCQNKKGFAPLHIAVIEKNLEVFELLLSKGAFVNILTKQTITPLHLACFHNLPQVSNAVTQTP